jgi:hypothetical protein
MASFQKIVVIAAIVILIIALAIIGIALKKSVNNDWPPIIPDCPDYWIGDGSGNNASCINVKDLGVCTPQSGQKHLTMNFNNTPFNGSNSNCAKYTWANACKISWDGITYGINNPCNT